VILSTVRSSPGGLGALEDEHLLDVALTRAKYGDVVEVF
jgi:superfamily I DNA and/or RNA helicase